jgi:tetratricopeptide (TPR) repeat protein
MRAVALLLALCAAGAVRADEDEADRTLFDQGRRAYDRGDYRGALDVFREVYRRSHRNALLYNMARAEEQLGRPGEAAETLRKYLREEPDTPDREAIEQHLRALEDSQRLLRPPPEKRHTGLIVGLVLGGVAVVALGVGLGVGLSIRGPGYSPADVGPLKSTP